jgi:hypothetical protein
VNNPIVQVFLIHKFRVAPWRRNGILWDLVALYSPAAQWENASPDFVDGPVVKAGDTLEKHLRKEYRTGVLLRNSVG